MDCGETESGLSSWTTLCLFQAADKRDSRATAYGIYLNQGGSTAALCKSSRTTQNTHSRSHLPVLVHVLMTDMFSINLVWVFFMGLF